MERLPNTTIAPGERLIFSPSLAGPNNCAAELELVYFVMAGDAGPELVSTLGPSFCFETETESTYVLGEPFLTRADFGLDE